MLDYREKILAHWDLINLMSKKRFHSDALAEEAALYVIDALQKDNWKKVAAFSGRSTLKTFLRSLIFRLLEDFARQKFGRKQPPSWVKKLGGVYLYLYKVLCLQRLDEVSAVEAALTRLSACLRREIEDAVFTILEKIPDCRKHQSVEVEYRDGHAGQLENSETPEMHLEKKQKKRVFSELFNQLFDKDVDQEVLIELTGEEKLLIRMRYVDGLSTKVMAEMLDQTRHQVNGKLRRLLNKIEKLFNEHSGVQEVKTLLR